MNGPSNLLAVITYKKGNEQTCSSSSASSPTGMRVGDDPGGSGRRGPAGVAEWETIQADQAAEVLRGWPGGNDPLEGLA
jgi:hypothetical protein